MKQVKRNPSLKLQNVFTQFFEFRQSSALSKKKKIKPVFPPNPSFCKHPLHDMKPTSPAIISNITTLLKQDLSTRDIAECTGTSQSTVCNIKKKYFPERNGKKPGHPVA